jgi:hypothetical protein
VRFGVIHRITLNDEARMTSDEFMTNGKMPTR